MESTNIRYGQSERIFAWVLPAAAPACIVCSSFEEGRMSEQLTQIPDGKQTKIYTWHENDDPYDLLVKHLPPGTLGIDERTQFVFAERIMRADTVILRQRRRTRFSPARLKPGHERSSPLLANAVEGPRQSQPNHNRLNLSPSTPALASPAPLILCIIRSS